MIMEITLSSFENSNIDAYSDLSELEYADDVVLRSEDPSEVHGYLGLCILEV